MNIRSRLLLGAVAMGVAATMGQGAQAQDGIEIVTVTAAKREQNLQDVPISMSVVGQRDLEKYNLADLKDIAAQIPGMTIGRGQTYNTLYLRGFGTNPGPNPAVDQTVALYVDGIFQGRARQYMAPFFDVSRVEILRGPQGALLGKNTAAGAVSIVTNNPTDEFEAGATASYLFDRKGVDIYGYMSGPVTDTLNARLAMKFVDKNGWVKNLADNTDVPTSRSIQGRITLQWRPSEGIDVVTKYQYDSTRADGRANNGYLNGVRSGVDRIQNSPGLLGVSDLDRQTDHHFANTATIDFGNVTFVSVSGYDFYKGTAIATGFHAPGEPLHTDYFETFSQGSQEFRLLSPTDQTFEWIVGIYADYSNYRLNNVIRYLGFPTPAFNDQQKSFFTQSAYTYSAYATVTWNITDALRLIPNVRGTQIGKKGDYRLLAPDFGGLALGAPRTVAGTLSEGSFDPSVTLQYDVTDDIMVYASWSKGSKGGVFQGASRAVTASTFQLKPEVSTNYEIGAKTELWDWLTFNVSAFILDFKNLQVGQYVVPPGSPVGTNPSLISVNAGAATSRGVEVFLDADLAQWVEGLGFTFSGSFVNAYYTDYAGSPCIWANSPMSGVGLAALSGGSGGGTCVNGFLDPPSLGFVPGNTVAFNGKGLRFQAIPIWSGTMELNYVRPVFDGLKIAFNVSADMLSSVWGDLAVSGVSYNPNLGLQPGNTKINFRVALGDIDDKWTVAIIGRNVNDILTTSGVYRFGAYNVYTVDEDRSISIQGSLKL